MVDLWGAIVLMVKGLFGSWLKFGFDLNTPAAERGDFSLAYFILDLSALLVPF